MWIVVRDVSEFADVFQTREGNDTLSAKGGQCVHERDM